MRETLRKKRKEKRTMHYHTGSFTHVWDFIHSSRTFEALTLLSAVDRREGERERKGANDTHRAPPANKSVRRVTTNLIVIFPRADHL